MHTKSLRQEAESDLNRKRLEWERYKKLKSESNLKTNIHFYNQMIGMSYEEAKRVYFHEVGR